MRPRKSVIDSKLLLFVLSDLSCLVLFFLCLFLNELFHVIMFECHIWPVAYVCFSFVVFVYYLYFLVYFFVIHFYLSRWRLRKTSARTMQEGLRLNSLLRFWASQCWLRQNLDFKGWNSHVHSEFPENMHQQILVGIIHRTGVPSLYMCARAVRSSKRVLLDASHMHVCALVGCGQMGSTPMGPLQKWIYFDRLGKKVLPGTFGNIKVGLWEYPKNPSVTKTWNLQWPH